MAFGHIFAWPSSFLVHVFNMYHIRGLLSILSSTLGKGGFVDTKKVFFRGPNRESVKILCIKGEKEYNFFQEFSINTSQSSR